MTLVGSINTWLGNCCSPDRYRIWSLINLFLMVLVFGFELAAVLLTEYSKPFLITSGSLGICQSLLDLIIEIYAREWEQLNCINNDHSCRCCASWKYNLLNRPLFPLVIVVGLGINIGMLILAIKKINFPLAVLTVGMSFIVLMMKVESSVKHCYRVPPEEAVNQRRQELINLNQEVAQLTQNRNNLNQEVNQLAQNRNNLNQEVAQLTQNRNNLNQEVAQLTQNRNNLNQQVVELTQQLANLTEQVAPPTQ